MSWSQLSQQADAYYADLSRIKRLKKQQAQVSKQLHFSKAEVKRLQRLVYESEEKLNEFEKESFKNRLKKWLTNWEEKLNEEEQILIHRKLKLEEALSICEQLSDEYNAYEQQLVNLNQLEIEAKITVIKLQMESWLKEHNIEKANKLQKLTKKLQQSEKILQEVKEAIFAGEQAKKALLNAYESLQDARGLSTWDTIGGGLLVTDLKYKKIDVGNAYLQSAQRKLQQFQNELLDIDEIPAKHLHVSTSGVVKFADYFIDGIFSSLHVGSKIDEAQAYTRATIDDVKEVLERVKGKEQMMLTIILELKEEIEKIYKSSEGPLNL